MHQLYLDLSEDTADPINVIQPPTSLLTLVTPPADLPVTYLLDFPVPRQVSDRPLKCMQWYALEPPNSEITSLYPV
jgi:hypothetical protein